MRTPRLYTPQPLPLGQTIELEVAAGHYIGKVLRMQEKQEVILFHILDRNELEFEFENRTKFVDMESGEEITTDPWHIKNDYKNLILDIQKYYSRNCRLNKIDYVPLYTDDSLDKGLSEYFNKRQRLG